MAYQVDEKKVAVLILARQPVPEEIINPILWGLEEEGIPVEFGEAASGSAEALGKQAANGSPLNVGIGINPTEQAVVLHHRDLPASEPLIFLRGGDNQPWRLRQLGLNAARLVKGDPLAFQTGDELNSAYPDPSERSVTERPMRETEELQALLVQVLQELFKKE